MDCIGGGLLLLAGLFVLSLVGRFLPGRHDDGSGRGGGDSYAD